jgi:diadenosine tetraphosphate (Ap4A) HIT family hydrolase
VVCVFCHRLVDGELVAQNELAVGVNVGEAGGQTIAHAHLHVIPRYRGDVVDPRGGIRAVIPAMARYREGR